MDRLFRDGRLLTLLPDSDPFGLHLNLRCRDPGQSLGIVFPVEAGLCSQHQVIIMRLDLAIDRTATVVHVVDVPVNITWSPEYGVSVVVGETESIVGVESHRRGCSQFFAPRRPLVKVGRNTDSERKTSIP